MHYIELIGPQAVGKTALLNLLVNRRSKKVIWRTYQEAIFEIVNSIKWSQLTTNKSRLLYFINMCNIARYKKKGISNTLIAELSDDIPYDIQRKYEFLMAAQLKSIEALELSISPINKCSLIVWHLNALKKIFGLELLAYNSTILFTEGPVKTHYGLQYIDMQNIGPETLPKAVIYCTISQEENLHRIKKRAQATGRVSKIHNELNNENLDQLVAFTHHTVEQNVSYLKSLGIPYIKVDLSHPLSELDLIRLEKFLNQYSTISPEIYQLT